VVQRSLLGLLGYGAHHSIDDLGGAPSIGGHRNGRYRQIEGTPFVSQLLPTSTDVPNEEGTGPVHLQPLHGCGKANIEMDHQVAQQSGPDLVAEDGSPTNRQDAVMLGQPLGHGITLKRTEVVLTLLDEEVGYRATSGRLDIAVGVPKVNTPPGSQLLAYR
jgi:hypothetical protein